MGRFNGGTIENGSIVGTDISGQADIRTETMRHMFKPSTNFGTAIGAAPTSREERIYTADGVGTIKGFHASCNDTGSSSSITVDLKKNGTTVLSAPITITNATPDKQKQDAILSVITLAAGDILSAEVVVSSSTGMQGLQCWANVEETVSPV